VSTVFVTSSPQCLKKIKRHFSSIKNHLNEHQMSLDDYVAMFDIPPEHNVTAEGPIGHEKVLQS
jgi:predicted transcriptional regulator